MNRRSILVSASCAAAYALLHGSKGMAAGPTMLSRKIPGATLPAMGLGTYDAFDVAEPADREAANRVMAEFVRLGGRLVDSSPMYGTAESVIGDAVTYLGLSKDVFLATKVWTTGREAGIEQAHESMRRMRSDKLDLLQVHNLLDVETHLNWLQQWKQSGKVRYIGVTHYSESAYPELEKHITARKVDFVQFNYSMSERQAEQRLLPAAQASGIAVIINRPFAKASLFNRVKGRHLPNWVSEFDCTSWAQFFLKYILAHPAVTCAIPATRNVQHLVDNMQAGRGRLPDPKMRQRMVAFLKEL